MSAARYEISMDEIGCWARQSNETWECVMHFTKDSDSLQERIAEKVIRQQARDIDQLRADLAAAVAERDELRETLVLVTADRDGLRTGVRLLLWPDRKSSKSPRASDFVQEKLAAWGGQLSGNEFAKLISEHNQLRARLAAIDAAPTVAVAQHVLGANDEPYAYLSYTHADVPAHDVELIARPAKDQA